MTHCNCGTMPMLSGVRVEPGVSAEPGVCGEGGNMDEEDEAEEEGPEEAEEGPAGEGDGRICDGGADGGGISMFTEGLLAPGVCCWIYTCTIMMDF